MRKQNGITLIALIISIIILLILAIVTIRTIKDSNIIKYAQDATNAFNDGQENEKVQLAVQEAYLAGKGTITKDNLDAALKTQFGANNYNLDEEETYFIITAPSKKQYKVSKNGGLTEYKESKEFYVAADGSWKEKEDNDNSTTGSITAKLYKTSDNFTPVWAGADEDVYGQKGNAYKLVIEGTGNEEMPSLINVKDKSLEYNAWLSGLSDYFSNSDLNKYYNEENSLFMYITEVNISGVKNVGYGAFMGCKSLTTCVIGSGVETIEDIAFSGCEKLKNISLPESVTEIGISAFGSSGIENINLKNVEKICDTAFNHCHDLNKVEIGDKLETMGKEVFKECYALEKIIIKSSNTNMVMADTFNDMHSNPTIYVKNETVKYNIKNTCETTLTIEVKTQEEMDNL